MVASPEHAGALPLAGRVVVVTGRLTQYTRAQAEAEIRRLGGTVTGGVTGKTDYLIAGEDAGSKLAKAQTLGIRIFSEEDFRQLGAGEPAPAAASAPAASASAASPRTTAPPRDKAAATPAVKRVSAAPKRDPVEWARALDRARELVRAWLDRDGGRQVYGQRPGDTPEGRAVLDAPPLLQVAAIHASLEAVGVTRPDSKEYWSFAERNDWQWHWKTRGLLGSLLRRRQPFTDEDVEVLVRVLADALDPWYYTVPTAEILRGLAVSTAPDRWTAPQRAALQQVLDRLPQTYRARGERLKLARLLRGLLGLPDVDDAETGGRLGPMDATDYWGYAAQTALRALDEPHRVTWVRLLVYARDGSGSKPSGRWLEGARPLIEKLGADAHLELTGAWLDLLNDNASTREQARVGSPQIGAYRRRDVPSETNAAILRGLAWLSTLGETRRIAPQLAAAAIRCYQKVPGDGPRAVAVGNACLFALGTLDPLESIHHFQAARHRVTYLPALRLIDAALEQAARQAGMSKEDLEDLTVPTFGLEGGCRREELGQYTAELVVEPGSVEWRWSKAGAPLRTEPAAVRREFPEEVKALKATGEEIRRHLPVDRKRLEWALMVGRTWSLADWRARCLNHPLVSILARRLIWCFEGPTVQVGAWDGRHLVDAEDRPLSPLPSETRVRLWHPIGWDPAQVLAWRAWLERHQITQPFKQAHREVYVLTDAEVRTRTYSNRFAAHILRQHQMHALAQQRGWKAPLAMVYDGGWDTQLTLALPAWGLEAAYFVEGVLDDANWEAGYNDNGVCLFVSTDQVRFHRAGESEPLPLTEVPALAFSGVMRDVDLFVGVASVGADPTWHDRGNDQQRAYWQRYAFGYLSESARTRRRCWSGCCRGSRN